MEQPKGSVLTKERGRIVSKYTPREEEMGCTEKGQRNSEGEVADGGQGTQAGEVEKQYLSVPSANRYRGRT